MKIILFSNILILLFVFITQSLICDLVYSVEQVKNVTLEDLKSYAKKNNFKIASLRSKVEVAQNRLYKINSLFLPKLGLVAGNQSNNSETFKQTTLIGYAYGNINLFNGFKDVLDKEKEEYLLQKDKLELEREIFEVESSMEEDFYNYIYKKELLAIKTKILAINEKHRQLISKTRTMGFSSNTDVMEFELQNSLLNSEIIGIKQDMLEIRINLQKLLGEEIGKQIEPIGKLPHFHLAGNITTYLSKVNQSAPVAVKSIKDLSIAQIERKIVNSKFFPQIDFEINAGYLPSDSSERTSRPEIKFLLLAKMELFSGFETTWAQKESLAYTNQLKSQLKGDVLSTVTDVERSFRRMKSIEERIDIESNNEEFSKKYYESVFSEYRRGFKNSPDLISALEKIREAAERRLEFKFEFLKEKIKFEKIIGAYLDKKDTYEHENI